MLWSFGAIGICCLFLIGYLLSTKEQREIANLVYPGLRLTRLAPSMLFFISFLKSDTFIYHRLHAHIQRVYGQKNIKNFTRMYIAELSSWSLLGIFFAFLLAFLKNDPLLFFAGMILAVLLPIFCYRELLQKWTEKEREILLELPEFIHKLFLLVESGEPMIQAFTRCIEEKKKDDTHFLYKELTYALNEMRTGKSFSQILEHLNRRCAVQEISLLTTTLLLNMRRGGNELRSSLRDLARTMIRKRTTICRVRGQEASSKLVFPLIVIFIIILVLVGMPALKLIQL